MKKICFGLLVLFFVSKTPAQVVFCPPGAEWNYNFTDFFIGKVLHEKITYSGDAVIANETVKVLFHSRFFVSDNYVTSMLITYIKQVGDTIFMKNDFTLNNWQILANFNCQIGTGWANPIHRGNTVVNHFFRVDSVDYVSVNGISLKRLHVNYNHDLTAWGPGVPITITERLGSNYFLFNYYCHPVVTDDDLFTDYLCYRDNDLGTQQFTQKPCNNVDFVGLQETGANKDVFDIYPNPAQNSASLYSSRSFHEPLHIKVLDVSGKLILQKTILSEAPVLQLESYPPGMYFIQVYEQGKLLQVKKLLIVR